MSSRGHSVENPDDTRRRPGYLYAASKDVLAIEALSGLDTDLHSEAIAFHSQQAAEKMVKAVYTTNDTFPPRSHDS